MFIDDGGDDEAAVARAAVAAVGRALDAPPPAAAIERNYGAPRTSDLEGRLVSVIDAALDAALVSCEIVCKLPWCTRDPQRGDQLCECATSASKRRVDGAGGVGVDYARDDAQRAERGLFTATRSYARPSRHRPRSSTTATRL